MNVQKVIKSDNLWDVLKSIQNIDENIFYQKRLFNAYLRDLYIGRKVYLDVFLAIVSCLPQKKDVILRVSEEDFKKLVISSPNIDKKIHNQLLIYCYNIYVKCVYLFPPFIDSSSKKMSAQFAEHIDFFDSNLRNIVWGDEVLLSWNVANPYLLKLSDGEIMLNVTTLSKITISATSDKYTLYLYDQSNKMIEKKQIELVIRHIEFCMFCGYRHVSSSDKYCCCCGKKII